MPPIKLQDVKLNPAREIKETALRNFLISNKNKAAFLIGAGCSKSSQIYLGGEVTKICQKYAFIISQDDCSDLLLKKDFYNYESHKTQIEEFISSHQKEFDEFVNFTEEKFKNNINEKTILEKLPLHFITENGTKINPNYSFDELKDFIFWDTNYGNWFEEYNIKPAERQKLIEYLIEKKEPKLAYVLLAHLMNEKFVTNVFTTNFDDLINEALMYYYNERSRVYYQDGQAYFISVESSKPNIIKLHGDYLFQDLKNTVKETKSLDANMGTKFAEILKAKDLVIFGYAGADNSIMSILYELKKNQNYDFSIYWCFTDESKLNWRVIDLINNTEYSHWIKINSFEDFISKLWLGSKIDPVNIMKKAGERDKEYREFIEKLKKDGSVITKTVEDLKSDIDLSTVGKINTIKEKADKKDKPKEKGKSNIDNVFKSYDYFNAGINYENEKKYNKAIDEFTKAIEINKKYYDAYFNRAYIYQVHLGKFDEALLDYNKAIELKPDDFTAYGNRGILYSDLGRKEEALLDYNKAIELKPDHFNAYVNRGILYSDLGRKEEALLDYNKAIELKPDHFNAYGNRGNLYSDLGRNEEALLDYNKAIELKPDDFNAYVNRGNLYTNLGRKEEALLDYNKAIELKPCDFKAYVNRGLLYSDLGRKEEALLDYNKAIELKPDDSDAYVNRGNLYTNLGRKEEALLDYNKAIELKPDDSDAYANRGILYIKLGENKEAIADYLKCAALKPGDIGISLGLTELYILVGEYEKAKAIVNEIRTKEKTKKEELIFNYHHGINSCMLGENYTDAVNNIEKLMNDNNKITWSFDEIEAWLAKTKMPDAKKKFITELTKKLKKKKEEKIKK